MPLVNWAVDKLPRPLVRRVIHKTWKYQEPELRRLSDYLDTSRTAVDVGTWWGPWTAALAKQCPEVHSFEPQPQLAAQLRTWVPSNVVVHEHAVSDHEGRAQLSRPDARPGTDGLASLRKDIDGDTSGESVEVSVTTIDRCRLSDVGFMKIDVEGFELAALRGAEATIVRDRPSLMVEIEQRHLDQPIDTVFAWLIERDYRGWFLRKKRWIPLEDFDVDRDQTASLENLKSAEYVNAFLFVPSQDRWQP